MDAQTGEIVLYWQRIISTLHQRGLLSKRPQQGGYILPEADALLLVDRAIFVLDMSQLGGVARERWLDDRLWDQWRAALQGRRVFVADGGGLAICIAREPGLRELRRLPAMIRLDFDTLPENPYTVTLGYTKRGPVLLDLAGDHRAVLVGGTSGYGKTNLMQSAMLQLVAKHAPGEVQFAVVDTKEIDFGGDYDRLPHLFQPIARSLEAAARLAELVEAERLRRQAIMAQAGAVDWRDLDGELGLLLLIVDEAADFTRTSTMETLVEIARKGRAFGVSIILGTQSPSSKVIDPQIRANLPTPIAFKTRTYLESQVILGRKGAEDLGRPGLALAFLGGDWQTVQTLRVDADMAGVLVERVAAPPRPALTEIEADMVHFADKHLGGCFIIGKLYAQFVERISKRRLAELARQWEARGWLTVPKHATDPRRVTDELLSLVSPYPAPDGQGGDRVTGVIGDDREGPAVTGPMTGDDLPPFLCGRAVTG